MLLLWKQKVVPSEEHFQCVPWSLILYLQPLGEDSYPVASLYISLIE